jgi:predicted nuclease of predicted toxin-antitoxin system
MKLLFDANLSFRLCRALDDLFPGSTQVRSIGLADAHDRAVRDYANANGFAIVTLDSDFAEMAALLGAPPKIIWLRSGNLRTAEVEALLRRHAGDIEAFERDNAACLEIY